jgi:hyperosmotically inducible periplasmic protein
MRTSALVLSALLLIAALLFSARAGSAQAQGKPAADNTAVNQRDRSHQTLTPIDQSSNPADLQMTRDIRRSIVKDDTLSTDARNIKIITRNGAVTLRGPVKTDQEKADIAAKVAQVARNYRVDDEIEVAGQ